MLALLLNPCRLIATLVIKADDPRIPFVTWITERLLSLEGCSPLFDHRLVFRGPVRYGDGFGTTNTKDDDGNKDSSAGEQHVDLGSGSAYRQTSLNEEPVPKLQTVIHISVCGQDLPSRFLAPAH